MYNNSSCSTHGGVGIYLRDCFEYTIISIENNSVIWDGMFIEVAVNINNSTDSKTIIIGNVYRPPQDTVDNYRIFIDDLDQTLCKLQM